MADNNTNARPWYLKPRWQVLMALVAGVAFGWLVPQKAEDSGFVGGLFLTRLNGRKIVR